MSDPNANPVTGAIGDASAKGWRKYFNAPKNGGSGSAPVQSPPPRKQLAKLAQIFESSKRGWFWATDAELRLTYVSDHIAKRLGCEAGDMLGSSIKDLFLDEAAEDGSSNRKISLLLNTRSKFSNMEVRADYGGPDIWWSVSGQPDLGKEGQFLGYWGSGIDVTTDRQSRDESSRLTHSDTLTGLASRHKISQRLDKALQAYKVAKRSCTLLMIDLDRFKQVNDTLGHQAGDELLRQASQRLTRVAKEDWDVGRLGGDEFQVIIPDMDDRGEVADAAKKMIAMISQPYTIDGTRCVIGASVGIAIAPYDGITSEELTRSADLALYAAKNDGRGRYRFYSNDLHADAEDLRQIEDELRDALARGEIWLAYQPVVSAMTNEISGFEALLRWEHPERGNISPAIFIPIAEEANLIAPLGEWALRKACEDAASWPGSPRVAVNVSPIQFEHASLLELVTSALANSGLSPDRLELEITESVFLGEGADIDRTFMALKKLGVRLALDDFGTGYSSLSYLKSAPFDKIKIDQSFVRDAALPGNRNAAIITAIVSLAEALHMETTAEGIETLDTLELITKLRVSHIQGYVYSRPLHHEDIMETLRDGNLVIKPTGPDVNRSDRKTLYRKVGVIHEDHRYEVTMRNISRTGAMIEGLNDVPKGTQFVIDFGEGQLAVATVRRSEGDKQGLHLEIPLISDGSDGLCTRTRVSPYVLAAAGMPLAALPSGQYPLVMSEEAAKQNGKGFSLPTFTQSEAGGSVLRVA